MKNLVIRAMTGALYVLILVGCVVYSPATSFALFGILAAATIMEFGALINAYTEATIIRPINALAGFILVAVVQLFCMASPSAGRAAALYGLVLLYIIISELYRRSSNPLLNWALSFAAQIYIAVPFSLIPLISVLYDTQTNSYNYTWVYTLAIFIFLWTNDTGAYLCGSALHKVFPAKLFPRISPHKSWVGSIGGGILTLAASSIMCYFFPHSISLVQWLGLALVVVVFGTWGDLVESLLKRQFGIKDSGHVLPGHGGLLDRFDSALLAIPASVAYIYIIL